MHIDNRIALNPPAAEMGHSIQTPFRSSFDVRAGRGNCRCGCGDRHRAAHRPVYGRRVCDRSTHSGRDLYNKRSFTIMYSKMLLSNFGSCNTTSDKKSQHWNTPHELPVNNDPTSRRDQPSVFLIPMI
eukprot:1468974-Rhodomonas_salina.1